MSIEERQDLVFLLGIFECLNTDNEVLNCLKKSNLSDDKKKKFIKLEKQILLCHQNLKNLPEFKGLSYYLYNGSDRTISFQSSKDIQDFIKSGDLDRFPFLSTIINHLLDKCEIGKIFSEKVVSRDTGKKVNTIITKMIKGKEHYLVVKENRWDPTNERTFDGKWGFVKGGVKVGETDKEAVFREVSEELNQKLNPSVKEQIKEIKKGYYTIHSSVLNERSFPKLTQRDEVERDELRRKICRLHFNRNEIYSPEYIFYIRKLMDLQGEVEKTEWKTIEQLENLDTNNSINNYFNFDRRRRIYKEETFMCPKRYEPRKWLD